ncbi:pyridoxal phosphate-dependent aminotransferase [Flavobacterium sp. LMO8]|uniref:DegT/DnrJ/EryC1/StrS family aminotransferase n=1 Tax=Flavobacterium sp. LMO8 TaxID=2654244 RepID=UPI0012927C87|nr:DegT/DnrJ/EryC1/StrS family aminotransferase [Flavobacterium sp. LMO8]MQP24742.1 pyridoxal phosphate-dependent aminotransferase [Flavobacterium sp. LMO8]
MNKRIWLSSPHMGGNEINYIHQAFDSNWIAPLGPNVTEFENDLKSYLQDDIHVAALSSGTSAIHLGLILLGVKRDDVVICQSMTFSASANPILYLGATPVFIDSESLTWNMCPIALENAILLSLKQNCKPKAIIVVHLYGMPAQLDVIEAIALKYDIPILEDSAEALGSSFKGKMCGTFGTMGVLSFNGNKIITTSGGGALVVKSADLKKRAVYLATQARDEEVHYQHSEVGYNYRMSNVCAGIGRGQMEVLDRHIELRRNIYNFYVAFFTAIDYVTVLKAPSNDFVPNHWLTTILIHPNEKNKNREALRLHLDSLGIESRPLWKPMHLQPIFSSYPYYGSSVAEDLFEIGLCLPSGSNLTSHDQKRIALALESFFNK